MSGWSWWRRRPNSISCASTISCTWRSWLPLSSALDVKKFGKVIQYQLQGATKKPEILCHLLMWLLQFHRPVTWGLLHLGHLQLKHCKYVQSMLAQAKKDSGSGDVSGETKLMEEYILDGKIKYPTFCLDLVYQVDLNWLHTDLHQIIRIIWPDIRLNRWCWRTHSSKVIRCLCLSNQLLLWW